MKILILVKNLEIKNENIRLRKECDFELRGREGGGVVEYLKTRINTKLINPTRYNSTLNTHKHTNIFFKV